MEFQVPPVYSSKESAPMVAWFKLLWKWIVDEIYTMDEVDALIEANRIQIGTAVATTTGVTQDYSGIPEGTRRIVIMFNGVSLNDGDALLIQLGVAAGIETTGYVSTSSYLDDGGGAAGISNSTSATNGFYIATNNAGDLFTGHMLLTLTDTSTNTWIQSHTGINEAVQQEVWGAGKKSLAGPLTTIRITDSSGGGTLDAGSFNIQYER